MIYIREAHQDDIPFIAHNMREIDQIECDAWSKCTPRQALRCSMAVSDEVYTVLRENVPVAMFGWGHDFGLGNDACVWFLGVEGLERNTREFLTLPQPYFEKMLSQYDVVYNHVSKDNKRAIRFLKYHGFVLGGEVTRNDVVFVRATRSTKGS